MWQGIRPVWCLMYGAWLDWRIATSDVMSPFLGEYLIKRAELKK